MRAIEFDEQLGNPKELAPDYSNLASLYLSQGCLDEAARYARRAVEIKETLDLSAEPWKTYNILARIAEAQGRAVEAAEWRRKEQESYAASAFVAHAIREWGPVMQSMVAACEGHVQAAKQVNSLLQQFEEGWPTTVAAVRRILDGERDIETLRTGLSPKSFVVIHTILSQLAGEAPPQQTPGVSPAQESLTLPDLLTLVGQAGRPDAPPGLGEQLYALTHTLSSEHYNEWRKERIRTQRLIERQKFVDF